MSIGFLVSVPIIGINSTVPWLVGAAHVLAGSSEVVLVYILLTYPWGRLSNLFDRWAMAVLVTLFIVIGIASDVIRGTCPYCPSSPGANSASGATSVIQMTETVAYALAGAVVLTRVFRRWFVATRPARRTLTPVLFGGVMAALVVLWRELNDVLAGTPGYASPLLVASDLAETLIPIGLLIGFLRLRLARGSIGELAVDLAMGRAVREQLQDVLRSRLGDPRLEVAFWSPKAGSYLDRDGNVLDPSHADPARAVRFLDREGEPQAVIVHDAALAEDPTLVDQVSAVVDLAVERITKTLPVGTVTFLVTDIEKSTELLGRLGERYEPVLIEHRDLIRRAVARWSGFVEECHADEFFTVFGEAVAAASAAVEIQRELAGRSWSGGEELRVRMGLHTGQSKLLQGEYVGLDVHRAARVCSAAHGGQIVLSDTAEQALEASDLGGAFARPLGSHQLKGFTGPEILYQLVVPGLRSEFPPLAAPIVTG
jgi:class 3 adenylate cyclase